MTGAAASTRPRSAAPVLLAFCLARNLASRRAIALSALAAFMIAIVAGFRMRGVRPEIVFFVKDITVHALCEVYAVLAAVAFGTGVWDEERQAGTLETLLARPIGRVQLFLVRLVAAVASTLAIVLVTYAGFAAVGAPDLTLALHLLPAPVLTVVALVPLFAVFGLALPRPAICSLLWGFFLEILIANMPGIVKALTVNFYARSLVAAAAAQHGIDPADIGVITPTGDVADLVAAELPPFSAPVATAVMIGFALVCTALGARLARRASVAARPGD